MSECRGTKLQIILAIPSCLLKYSAGRNYRHPYIFFSENTQFLTETLQMETYFSINRCTHLVCRGTQQKTGINNES